MIGLFKRRRPSTYRLTRSVLLLVSIVLFFALAPILERYSMGGLLLILNLYVTVVAATSELAEKRILFWIAISVAGASMILILANHYWPSWQLAFSSHLALALFFALVSVSLFMYLGRKGQITTDRILVSVSLYFLLGMTWFALYSLINLLHPGSFAEAGTPMVGVTHWSTMLYFSLVTLSTLGYGDIVAVTPPARMVATLEASAGVLYIAITVARLVGARSSSTERDD